MHLNFWQVKASDLVFFHHKPLYSSGPLLQRTKTQQYFLKAAVLFGSMNSHRIPHLNGKKEFTCNISYNIVSFGDYETHKSYISPAPLVATATVFSTTVDTHSSLIVQGAQDQHSKCFSQMETGSVMMQLKK